MRPRLRLDRTTMLVILGVLLFIAAYAGAVALSDRYYVISAPPSSVYSASPDGVKVFFTYLERLGVKPGVLQSMEDLPSRGTIIVAGPFTNPPTHADAEALGSWVRRGGRLVVVGPQAAQIMRPIGLGGSPSTGDASETLRPLFPGPYARGVTAVVPGEDRLLLDDSAWVAHFKDFSGQVLVTQKVGAGEVVWLAGPLPLTNKGIGLRDNGRLAVELATAGGGPVYFDEYHHGYVNQAGVWARLSTGGRAALLLLAVALGIALLAWARRTGPVIPAPAESPARGGAYIGQLAELYRKAGARADALSVLEDGLRRAAARSHGTIDAGLARHPDAAGALAASASLRESGRIGTDAFLSTARQLSRAREEIEGPHG